MEDEAIRDSDLAPFQETCSQKVSGELVFCPVSRPPRPLHEQGPSSHEPSPSPQPKEGTNGTQAEEVNGGVVLVSKTVRRPPTLHTITVAAPNRSCLQRNTILAVIILSIFFFICTAPVIAFGVGIGLYFELHYYYNVTNNMTVANRRGDIVLVLGDGLEAVPEGRHRVAVFRQLIADGKEIIPFNVSNGNCKGDIITDPPTNYSFHGYISTDPYQILDRVLLIKGSFISISFQLKGVMEVFLSRYESCLGISSDCVTKGNYLYRRNVTGNETLSIRINSSDYYYLLIRSKNGVDVRLDYNLYKKYYSQNKTFFTECQVSQSNPSCTISVKEGLCYFLTMVKSYYRPEMYFYHISAMAEREKGIQAGVKYLIPLVLIAFELVAIVIFVLILRHFFVLFKRRYYEPI